MVPMPFLTVKSHHRNRTTVSTQPLFIFQLYIIKSQSREHKLSRGRRTPKVITLKLFWKTSAFLINFSFRLQHLQANLLVLASAFPKSLFGKIPFSDHFFQASVLVSAILKSPFGKNLLSYSLFQPEFFIWKPICQCFWCFQKHFWGKNNNNKVLGFKKGIQ